MDFKYESERLILKVVYPSMAPAVLHFLHSNRDIFEQYESTAPDNFYTISYIMQLLSGEYKLALKGAHIRYWVFLKDNPNKIIGTVAFHNIRRDVYQSFELGYKFDRNHHHKGYAYEAISFLCEKAFSQMGFHRIEALVMRENTASIKLLENIGFEMEGISRSCTRIQGVWRDHLRFSLVKSPDGSA